MPVVACWGPEMMIVLRQNSRDMQQSALVSRQSAMTGESRPSRAPRSR